MTATNHALSGALIGLTINQPAIALPLAFVSHFVLDALPHFGFGHLKNKRQSALFFGIDAILLAAVMIFLYAQTVGWLVFACLFLAGSPDFVWAYRYIFQEKFGEKPERAKNWFNEFHTRIQTSQTFRGLFIEVPLAIALLTIIIQKL